MVRYWRLVGLICACGCERSTAAYASFECLVYALPQAHIPIMPAALAVSPSVAKPYAPVVSVVKLQVASCRAVGNVLEARYRATTRCFSNAP